MKQVYLIFKSSSIKFYYFKVIYRECDSDDEDYETVLLLRTLVEAEKNETKILNPSPSHPPLSALQLELKQICRFIVI